MEATSPYEYVPLKIIGNIRECMICQAFTSLTNLIFPILRKKNLKHTVYVTFPVLHSNELSEAYANSLKHCYTIDFYCWHCIESPWKIDKKILRNFIPANNTLVWVTIQILHKKNGRALMTPPQSIDHRNVFFEQSF